MLPQQQTCSPLLPLSIQAKLLVFDFFASLCRLSHHSVRDARDVVAFHNTNQHTQHPFLVWDRKPVRFSSTRSRELSREVCASGQSVQTAAGFITAYPCVFTSREANLARGGFHAATGASLLAGGYPRLFSLFHTESCYDGTVSCRCVIDVRVFCIGQTMPVTATAALAGASTSALVRRVMTIAAGHTKAPLSPLDHRRAVESVARILSGEPHGSVDGNQPAQQYTIQVHAAGLPIDATVSRRELELLHVPLGLGLRQRFARTPRRLFIAVSGPSGSGKSLLGQLLERTLVPFMMDSDAPGSLR
jgi:ABC-type multidrug transport system fused ATPase/permease subunit